jgi:hypothetical protein
LICGVAPKNWLLYWTVAFLFRKKNENSIPDKWSMFVIWINYKIICHIHEKSKKKINCWDEPLKSFEYAHKEEKKTLSSKGKVKEMWSLFIYFPFNF